MTKLYYLRLWHKKADKLKERDIALGEAVKAINTRKAINSGNTINNTGLVKKLFHDIPRARAIEFFKR